VVVEAVAAFVVACQEGEDDHRSLVRENQDLGVLLYPYVGVEIRHDRIQDLEEDHPDRAQDHQEVQGEGRDPEEEDHLEEGNLYRLEEESLAVVSDRVLVLHLEEDQSENAVEAVVVDRAEAFDREEVPLGLGEGRVHFLRAQDWKLDQDPEAKLEKDVRLRRQMGFSRLP
jgi:hypothetical protein